jgi:murein DD-endopeptidase MepM/ murein hydrolase activator NlpD
MSEQKKPSFAKKWKDGKINRAAVVTTVILIVAVAVIVAVTVANNRSKDTDIPKNDPPVTDTKPVDPPKDTQTPDTDKVPEDTKPTTPPSTNVEEKLPSFILPVSGALSKKHDPKLQVYSQTMKDYRVHVGLDIVTEANAPVYASADGTVSRIWKDTKMGYCIAVEHSGDAYTIYKNLSETLPEGIKEGTAVRSGQLIATVGESAMVEIGEEPHLHFEMTVGDLMVDPLEYFDDKALESLSIDASFGE